MDRQGTRTRCRVRLGAGVQAERFDTVVAIRHEIVGRVD
jgi:hypothetical protein